jgi:acetyl esterase/lipase
MALSSSRRTFLSGTLVSGATAWLGAFERSVAGAATPQSASAPPPRPATHPDASTAPREIIPIWPEGVPGRKADATPEQVEDGRIYNVHDPTLAWFPPAQANATRTAFVVCPGGGYARLAMTSEASGVTRFLNGIGVSAFVLKYRLGDYGHPAPLRDVLRAIRLVRARAASFGVRADRIGVMGSSAGGHLAACAATLFDDPEGKTGGELDAVSARPDFAVLQYPVITMGAPFVHTGSRRNLIGDPAPEALVAKLSVERQVSKDTAPCFLVHTAEDTTVSVENSLLFYDALRRAGVPAEMHLYEQGAHGFGTREGLGTTSLWTARWAEWMRASGWLEQ